MGYTDEEAERAVKAIGEIIDTLLECRKACENRRPIEATVHCIDAQTRINALAVLVAGDRQDDD